MTKRTGALAVDKAGFALTCGAGLLALSAAVFAVSARAQDATVITSHGISTFGELKYPADFKHLDYVNPDAPKGGEISEWAPGGFDSMNPYSVKGRAGALASIPSASDRSFAASNGPRPR